MIRQRCLKKMETIKEQLQTFKKIAGDRTPQERMNQAAVVMLKQELETLGQEYNRVRRMKNGI